jgi:poly-gamma-glutamate synthesis protein (capsule biosynthesis protein)
MPIFTFTQTAPHRFRITHVEAVPIWVQIRPKIRLIDLTTALNDPRTPPADRAVYRHAYEQIRHYLDAYGAARDGLVDPS